jgi:hypothetical protein
MFTAQRSGLFAPHGIFDGGHARDATRNRNRLVDLMVILRVIDRLSGLA